MATFTFQNATVLGNGRIIRLVFQGGALASTVYSTPDWIQGKINGKNVSLSTGVKLAYVGTCTYLNGTNVQWIVDLEVVNATDVITYGQSVTVSMDAGYISDSFGNATGIVSANAPTNYSIVGTDGFMSSSIPSGSGGSAVTIYVSNTYGSDGRTFAQAQNVSTPMKTLGGAYNLMVSNGVDTAGCRIRMLQGDTESVSSQITFISGSGPSIAKPFIVDTYWNAYSGINPSWQGKRAVLSCNVASNGVFTFWNGNNLRGFIIFSGIEINGNFTSQTAMYGFNVGIVNLNFIDCYIHGFQYGMTVQYNTNNGINGWGDYFMIHRCIVADNIRGDAHGQGIYMIGYSNSLISQSTFHHNGYTNTSFNTTGILCHNCYIGIDTEGGQTTKAIARPPCIWRNIVAQCGSFGFQSRLGANTRKNVFTEVDVPYNLGSAGGRGSLNYIDRTTGQKSGGTYTAFNVWGGYTPAGGDSSADLPGQIRPTSHEFNIVVNALGFKALYSLYIDGSSTSTSLSHDHIIRNNTCYKHGAIGGLETQSNKPESISHTKNIIDVVTGIGEVDPITCISHGVDAGAPSTWQFLVSDNNLIKSTSSSSIARIGTNFVAIAQWRSTTGKDTNTITNVTPSYRNSSADIGTYGATVGVVGGITAYISNLRARGLSTWVESINDAWAIIKYMMGRYYVTNQPVLSDGTATSYYGAPDAVDPTENNGVVITPPGQEDIKFIVDSTVVGNNGSIDFGNIAYGGSVTPKIVYFQNYGTATGIVTNIAVSNITGTSFTLDPAGFSDPSPKLFPLPYNLGSGVSPPARNIGLNPNTEGSKQGSLVLTGDFGTKTMFVSFNVPTVVDAPASGYSAATGVYFIINTGGLNFALRT